MTRDCSHEMLRVYLMSMNLSLSLSLCMLAESSTRCCVAKANNRDSGSENG